MIRLKLFTRFKKKPRYTLAHFAGYIKIKSYLDSFSICWKYQYWAYLNCFTFCFVISKSGFLKLFHVFLCFIKNVLIKTVKHFVGYTKFHFFWWLYHGLVIKNTVCSLYHAAVSKYNWLYNRLHKTNGHMGRFGCICLRLWRSARVIDDWIFFGVVEFLTRMGKRLYKTETFTICSISMLNTFH